MQSYNLDRGKITRMQKTPDGFLRVWAAVSRVGDLQYVDKKGNKVLEHLSREELTNPASLKSADGLPVTFGHPPERVVTPDTARKYQRGSVGNVYFLDNDRLILPMTITDAETIDAVESGKAREISAGYAADKEPRPDGKINQLNRIYNHFSIESRGRAGSTVAVLDAADPGVDVLVMNDCIDVAIDNGDTMTKITLDGISSYDVEQGFAEQVTRLKLDSDNLTQTNKSLESDLAKRDGELAAANAKLADLQTQLDSAEADKLNNDAVATEIAERLALWDQVRPLLQKADPNFAPDYSLPPTEIKKLGIANQYPHLEIRNDSAYVDGLFDGLCPQLQTAAKPQVDSAVAGVDKSFAAIDLQVGQAGSDDPIAAARAKRISAVAAASKL